MAGQPAGRDGRPGKYAQVQAKLELYDLEADMGETRDLSTAQPEVVNRLLDHVEAARADLGDKLTGRIGAGVRQPGLWKP